MFEMYLSPKAAWDFIEKNRGRLEKESVLIAQREDGTEVFLTGDYGECWVFVDYMGNELYSEEICSQHDCEATIRKVYKHHLLIPDELMDSCVQEEIGEDDTEVEDEAQQIMDMIYEREDEMFLAAVDFLGKLLCVDDDVDTATAVNAYGIDVGQFIDNVLEYLAADFNVSVYRPTMIEAPDGSGEEILDEYPYDYLTEPDEDETKDGETEETGK